MTEKELQNVGIYIETYAGGFIIAHYPPMAENNSAFYGRSMIGRKQPLVSDPFGTLEGALSAATEFYKSMPVMDNA